MFCQQRNELSWLASVITGLACTGLRISELAALRWSDIDIELGCSPPDRREWRGAAKEIGNSRAAVVDRWLVFYGPRGSRLKPDTVRNILVRDLIAPLANKFPGTPGKKSFAAGWLGHADSEMVRHYHHLHDAESRQQMAKLVLLKDASKQPPGEGNGVATNSRPTSQRSDSKGT